MLSDKIIREAMKNELIDKKEMAERVGLPLTSLWYNIKEERKWTVERWVRALVYLNAAHVDGDKIIINTRYAKEFNICRTKSLS